MAVSKEKFIRWVEQHTADEKRAAGYELEGKRGKTIPHQARRRSPVRPGGFTFSVEKATRLGPAKPEALRGDAELVPPARLLGRSFQIHPQKCPFPAKRTPKGVSFLLEKGIYFDIMPHPRKNAPTHRVIIEEDYKFMPRDEHFALKSQGDFIQIDEFERSPKKVLK